MGGDKAECRLPSRAQVHSQEKEEVRAREVRVKLCLPVCKLPTLLAPGLNYALRCLMATKAYGELVENELHAVHMSCLKVLKEIVM